MENEGAYQDVVVLYYVNLVKLELCFLEIPFLYCTGLELDTEYFFEIWKVKVKWPCCQNSEGCCRFWCCCSLVRGCHRHWLTCHRIQVCSSSRTLQISFHYLESWCRCMCAALWGRVPACLQDTHIIKVGILEVMRSRGILQFIFRVPSHLSFPLFLVHPSSLPIACTAGFRLLLQTQKQQPYRGYITSSHNCERSNLYSKSPLLYHSWWFRFSGQTLTGTNGHLFVLLEVNIEF